jgi:glycosyltransferase involved in cell wall biosynthesis
MIQHSLLLPQRNAAETVRRRLPEWCRVLGRLGGAYEIICVDDASRPEQVDRLEKLLAAEPTLRVIHLERPSGLSTALTAAIAAACGEVVIAVEASDQYDAEQIPLLVRHLVRADLVFGRRRGWVASLSRLIALLPRRMLLGLEVHDPDCLFWAARREALQGIELLPGMHRFLEALVAARGFRVDELPVDRRRRGLAWPCDWAGYGPAALLAVWWLRRRLRPVTAREVTHSGGRPPRPQILRVDGAEELAGPTGAFQPGLREMVE